MVWIISGITVMHNYWVHNTSIRPVPLTIALIRWRIMEKLVILTGCVSLLCCAWSIRSLEFLCTGKIVFHSKCRSEISYSSTLVLPQLHTHLIRQHFTAFLFPRLTLSSKSSAEWEKWWWRTWRYLFVTNKSRLTEAFYYCSREYIFLSNIMRIILWFHDINLMLLEISPSGHGYERDGGRSKCTNANPQGQTGTRKER